MIKLRAKANRKRAIAAQYKGDNALEIQDFIGVKLVEEKNHEYLKSKFYKIQKGEWVVKEIFDNSIPSYEFYIMTEEELKEKYIIKGRYYAAGKDRRTCRKSKRS